ncbi:uncharacterized protein PG998_012055 [Apiospora kogelbergensis]|uniref:uncharacterized protein n=1 Tax=Apiospora kogelbergensis TaxID=1337665 RepID=UPI00313064B7
MRPAYSFITAALLLVSANGDAFQEAKDAGITEQQMKDAYPPRDPANVTNWFGTSLYGYDKCDEIDRSIRGWINEAYADANKLVNIEGVASNINWDSAAALEYLGPSALNKDQQAQIQAVLANVATVSPGLATRPFANWIRVRCDDPLQRCSYNCPKTTEDENKADLVAYSRNPDVAANRKWPDISVCPSFYGLRNLGNAIAYGSGYSNPKSKFDISYYYSRANVFLHELLHIDLAADSVNSSPNPQIRDLKIKYWDPELKPPGPSPWLDAYEPKMAKILARFLPKGPAYKQTGYFVQRNDDNLVYFSLANYVQSKIGGYPFLPVIVEDEVEIPRGSQPRTRATDPVIVFSDQGEKPASFLNFSPSTMANATSASVGSGCAAASTVEPQDGFEVGKKIPSTNYPKSYLEDRKKWIKSIQTPLDSAPTKDENKCHGVSGDTWVMSRDVAVDNAKAFCAQREKKVRYNKGSVNELELSVWKSGDDAKGPGDAPDCQGRFQHVVIDGCDGNDAVNNPHNYKFGATLTAADGWSYKLEPLSKQINEVSCDVAYKFLWDALEIRGKNLPDAKLGANGEGLKSQLSGCGALNEWKFERTPKDVKFQWYASGRLPIGTKACVGRALQSAGGSGKGNCHGAGRRRWGQKQQMGKRYIGIEDWPGYGDDSKHVFKGEEKRSIGIDDWPGYGDDSKHVFG